MVNLRASRLCSARGGARRADTASQALCAQIRRAMAPALLVSTALLAPCARMRLATASARRVRMVAHPAFRYRAARQNAARAILASQRRCARTRCATARALLGSSAPRARAIRRRSCAHGALFAPRPLPHPHSALREHSAPRWGCRRPIARAYARQDTRAPLARRMRPQTSADAVPFRWAAWAAAQPARWASTSPRAPRLPWQTLARRVFSALFFLTALGSAPAARAATARRALRRRRRAPRAASAPRSSTPSPSATALARLDLFAA